MPSDPLKTALLDLLHALPFPLILGGGYGLYLKQLHLQSLARQTAIRAELWPRPRSTEDLDLFLQSEVVCDVTQMRALRAALDAIGFSVVEKVKHMQFVKILQPVGRVKVDLLTGPIPDEATRRKLKIHRPRVRPKLQVELHAFLTDEALSFDESMFELGLVGERSTGDLCIEKVFIPQPFTFLLMKLHAFEDRKDDADRDLGRHHALDVYRIIAMLLPEEYDSVKIQVARYQNEAPVQRAREIIAGSFADENAIGTLRLREHELYTPEMDMKDFVSILHEFFGA